jgi:hypothetical protein
MALISRICEEKYSTVGQQRTLRVKKAGFRPPLSSIDARVKPGHDSQY